jgi:hypothetical protein
MRSWSLALILAAGAIASLLLSADGSAEGTAPNLGTPHPSARVDGIDA